MGCEVYSCRVQRVTFFVRKFVMYTTQFLVAAHFYLMKKNYAHENDFWFSLKVYDVSDS